MTVYVLDVIFSFLSSSRRYTVVISGGGVSGIIPRQKWTRLSRPTAVTPAAGGLAFKCDACVVFDTGGWASHANLSLNLAENDLAQFAALQRERGEPTASSAILAA
jgi:hypothetical protein